MLGMENENLDLYFGGDYGHGFAWGVTNAPAPVTSFYSPSLFETPLISSPSVATSPLAQPATQQSSGQVAVSSAQPVSTAPTPAAPPQSLIWPVLLVVAAIVLLK